MQQIVPALQDTEDKPDSIHLARCALVLAADLDIEHGISRALVYRARFHVEMQHQDVAPTRRLAQLCAGQSEREIKHRLNRSLGSAVLVFGLKP